MPRTDRKQVIPRRSCRDDFAQGPPAHAAERNRRHRPATIPVPAEFETYHQWDFSKFGRGERFYYRTLPREEFDETLAQVKRWGLDQFLKDRSYENLSYSVPA